MTKPAPIETTGAHRCQWVCSGTYRGRTETYRCHNRTHTRGVDGRWLCRRYHLRRGNDGQQRIAT